MMIEKRKMFFWVGPFSWGWHAFEISRGCIPFPWFFYRLWAHFPGLTWGNFIQPLTFFRHGFAVTLLGKVSCWCVAFCCLIIIINLQSLTTLLIQKYIAFGLVFGTDSLLMNSTISGLEAISHTCHPATSHQHLLPEFGPHRGSLGGWRWRLFYGMERWDATESGAFSGKRRCVHIIYIYIIYIIYIYVFIYTYIYIYRSHIYNMLL